MRCLAIDIGGTKTAAALVENLQITDRLQIATPGDNVAEGMADALAQIVARYQGRFDCVAVASTGIIRRGVLTALNPKNLGGLAAFPLQATIAQHTDKPIVLLNDAQAATCAEYHADATHCNNFAFITVSTGVGGGVILNGKLHTGENGIAGHIGHSLADPNGALCGCGRRGCVEAVASGRAIEAAAQASPKLVFEQFRQGDPQAVALVKRSAHAIAQLVADLKISLEIEKIAIGGSVGLAEGYLPLVKQILSTLPEVYQCELVSARYGQDAGLIGASWWAQQHFLSNTQG